MSKSYSDNCVNSFGIDCIGLYVVYIRINYERVEERKNTTFRIFKTISLQKKIFFAYRVSNISRF